MIPTNQLQISFDHEAIEKRFVILEAKRDSGDYRRSLIPDLVLQVGRALAAVYESVSYTHLDVYKRQDVANAVSSD